MHFEHYDPATRLGFINQVSTHPKATLASGGNIRACHPDAPITLLLDGNAAVAEYAKIAYQLDAEYFVNKDTLGYPQQPYGYKKDKALEWLKRFYVGVASMSHITHFMMWEDDILFTGPVDFNEQWKCAGHNITYGNKLHPSLLTLIEDFSGKKPKTDFYGTGGGSIFAKEPLMEHYWDIHKWLDGNLDWIQYNFFPTIGWMDCLTTVVYMLCGCDYDVNPFLYNIDPHNPEEAKLSTLPPQKVIDYFKNDKYNIIHNYKFFY